MIQLPSLGHDRKMRVVDRSDSNQMYIVGFLLNPLVPRLGV